MSTAPFEDPRPFLRRHKLMPKDSFGQNFLIAAPVAEAIVAAVGAREGETVVDIGTGSGTIARMVAPAARRVIAIERDRDLVAALRLDESLAKNIEICEHDAASYNYAALCAAEPTAIAGNLPYQITGKLIRALLTPPVKWRVAVIMVQKEVAMRLAAKEGDDDYGILSIFTRAACEVEKVTVASPACFHPAPRVTSMVVALRPRETPLAQETPEFVRTVHALFAARRKTVANSLSAIAPGGKVGALAVLESVGISSKERPEQLSIEQLNAIAMATFPAKEDAPYGDD